MEHEAQSTSSSPLRTRASRGVAFLGARAIIVRSIGLVRVAVLARLLTPADFGVFGLAVVLYAGLRIFSSFGINRYLIQKEDLDPTLVRSAWSYDILRGIVVGILIVILAPFYASALDSPDVGAILPVIALAAVVAGFVNPGFTLAERRVEFGPIVLGNVLVASLETVLVISLAYLLRSAQALAWGLVISMVNVVVLSFVLFDFVGWPRASAKDFRELFGVGKHLMVSSVATFVGKQVDNLIAGAMLGTAALGVYVVSYRLASLPFEMMSTIINRVAIPTLSRLQSKGERLARAFQGLADMQICALVPVIVLLVIFAEPIVVLIYGEKWVAGAPVLQALVFVMLGSGLYQIIEPYMLARGHFRAIARTRILEIAVFLPCAFLGARFWGLSGLAVGAGIGYMTSALALTFSFRRVGGPKVNWARRVGAAALSTVPSVLAAWLVQTSFKGPRVIETVLILGVFGTTYLVVTLLFRRALTAQMLDLVRSIFPREPNSTRAVGSAGT